MSKSLQDASSPPPQIVCDECLESFESLSEAREHVELADEWTSIVIVSITIRYSHRGKLSKTFAEEARIASLGWH